MKQDTTRFRKRRKQLFVEMFGGKCEICGYNKCLNSLHFHHINPKEKTRKFQKMLYDHSIDDTLNELKKCIMVCANCHGELHSEEYDSTLMVNYKPWLKCVCEICNIEFETKNSTSKYCSQKCSHINQRRSDRPTKEELKKLIDENSWLALGRMFSVSDNAVRKWARTYGIL